ncbi:MAG: penicillin-insensitive murein endopeptidase, partial [Nannocystaceae bacterium]
MVDPNDDSLEGESLEDRDDAVGVDEETAEVTVEHDRPRSTGVALLIAAGLVWAGVFAVRTWVPAPEGSNLATALDIPTDLPTVDEEDLAEEDASPPLDLGGGEEELPPEEIDEVEQPPADTTGGVQEEAPSEEEGAAEEEIRPARKIRLTSRDPQWSVRFRAPNVVHYTIRTGGTLKRVANLYKIFHHEIVALNPGKSLDEELPSGTRVAVYRRAENSKESESIEAPSRGTLTGAMPMPEGPGRILKHIPWKGWATVEAVAVMDAVLRSWDALDTGQPILVGNMSSRNGGPLKPHQSHQSGRDIDLSYPQII